LQIAWQIVFHGDGNREQAAQAVPSKSDSPRRDWQHLTSVPGHGDLGRAGREGIAWEGSLEFSGISGVESDSRPPVTPPLKPSGDPVI
jgi:hypothetical protein